MFCGTRGRETKEEDEKEGVGTIKVLEMREAVLAVLVVLGLNPLCLGSGYALEFDGSDDYVSCGTGPAITGTGPFAVSAWVKTDSVKGHAIVVQRSPSTADGSYGISILDDGRVQFWTYNSGYGFLFQSNVTVDDGLWHHVAGVRTNSTDGEIYVDGSLSGSDSGPAKPLNNVAVWFGGPGFTGPFVLDGRIDEVAIYDRWLDVNEIDSIYNSGVFADSNLVGYWAFDEGSGQVAYDGSANGNDGYLGSDPCGADPCDPAWVVSDMPCRGLTYHVDGASGSNGNSGLSREDAFATIQYGIDSANDCDTVLVWPGVYNESLYFVNKGITVRSAADAAVIEASDVYGVSLYTAEGPNTVLKNFIVRNCDTGIFVSSGAPTLEYLTIVDCNLGVDADFGAEPNIKSCILWNNRLGDFSGCTAEYSWVKPVAYWRFDEGSGTVAYDSAGNNDGTFVGEPGWTSGQVGGALVFDGNDDYISCDTGPAITGTGPFSVSAWVKTGSVKGHAIVVQRSEGSANGSYGVSILEDGRVQFYVYNGGYGFLFQSNVTVDVGLWHHVAVVRTNSTDGEIYVDGVLSASDSGPARYLNNVPVWIGGPGFTGPYRFDGRIDEVGIWDRAMSASEVRRLYEEGVAGQAHIDPGFADANGGDYHLLSERGRYRATTEEWLLDWVTSPCVDGGDPAVEPVNERLPNGGRVNMVAYGNTPYASMSEWTLAGDTNRDGIVNFVDFGILADGWLSALPWAE